jgi:oxaloacetate decarboxylase gamma subunit
MSELVSQGLTLSAFGMGTVFVFLTILVIATKTMSVLLTKFYPEEIVATKATVPSNTTQNNVDPKLLDVLSAAVKQYRTNQK